MSNKKYIREYNEEYIREYNEERISEIDFDIFLYQKEGHYVFDYDTPYGEYLKDEYYEMYNMDLV